MTVRVLLFLAACAFMPLIISAMTRQQLLHYYGRSFYEVRLHLAEQFYAQGKSPEESFDMADKFIVYLRQTDVQVEDK